MAAPAVSVRTAHAPKINESVFFEKTTSVVIVAPAARGMRFNV
jgi:hypothetical protein